MILSPTKSSFLELGRKQAQLFTENNVAYCEVLVTCSCPRHILLQSYYRLVREGKITAYEDLVQATQEDARQMTLDIAKGRMSNKELRELAKALLAIEYFLTFEKK